MAFKFVNHYRFPLSVAIMLRSPQSCAGEGGGWEQRGWWNINRGETKTVYGGDMDDLSRWWYYYAFATDGAQWLGDGRWVSAIPTARFNLCWGLGISGPPTRRADWVELGVGTDTHTLTLF